MSRASLLISINAEDQAIAVTFGHGASAQRKNARVLRGAAAMDGWADACADRGGASARNGPERRDRRETKRFLALAAKQPRLRIAF